MKRLIAALEGAAHDPTATQLAEATGIRLPLVKTALSEAVRLNLIHITSRTPVHVTSRIALVGGARFTYRAGPKPERVVAPVVTHAHSHILEAMRAAATAAGTISGRKR